jgi:hypothetical protein
MDDKTSEVYEAVKDKLRLLIEALELLSKKSGNTGVIARNALKEYRSPSLGEKDK